MDDNACRENLYKEIGERDWGVQQILTSANWGGVVGNFMTGGLNLQVRHNLNYCFAHLVLTQNEEGKATMRILHLSTLCVSHMTALNHFAE